MTSAIAKYLEACKRNATPEEIFDLKFRSGNGVPVERAMITADEWNRIRELVG